MDRHALVHVLSNKIGAAFPSNEELNPLGVLCALSLQALDEEQLRKVDRKLSDRCRISVKELADQEPAESRSANDDQSTQQGPDLIAPDIADLYGTPIDPRSRKKADQAALAAFKELLPAMVPQDSERGRLMCQLALIALEVGTDFSPFVFRYSVYDETGMNLETAIQKLRDV